MKHPWFFVIFGFLLLLGAWTSLIVVAIKHAPATVEIVPRKGH